MTGAKPGFLLADRLADARKLLGEVVDLLDANHIAYHLEGGTLLGVVRDGDLLAWDHDVDLSVPAECGEALLKLRWALLWKGYRTSVRRSTLAAGPVRKGSLSLFKVKPLGGYLRKALDPRHGFPVVDVFIKTRDSQHTWWQAKGQFMRVDNRYYESFDTLPFGTRRLRVPNHHEAYLEAKYGDWRTPVKEWDCARDERTVLGRQGPPA